MSSSPPRRRSSASVVLKWVVVLLVAAVVWAYAQSDAAQLLSLEGLKTNLSDLDAWRTAQPLRAAALFFVVYVVVTAVSLPGATLLTLAGGALFGLWQGLLLVSFASTTGATLAMLAARFVLGQSVQRRFGERLNAINAGIAKDGAFYLFTLRLVPVFPFFLINLLMGLTQLPVRSFYWVSQLGMLPGTVVYVLAGTQLANIDSLAGIVSPGLLGSFALLGVFPLITKWVLAKWQAMRVYQGYIKPSHFDRNMVVIGGGAAGLVSAYIAAAVKAKVTLVEAHKMGGDCLNYGCVPSKALIKSAKAAHHMRHAADYGLDAVALDEAQVAASFPAVMKRVHQVVSDIEPHDSVERYTGLGVDVVQGYARIVNPWTVEITGPQGEMQTLTTRSIVIATGARPFVPPLPGIEAVGVLTSDTMWEALSALPQAPKRVVVLGGGPIGCELSHAMARLGSGVTQIEMGQRILPREDEDAAAVVAAAMQRDGVTMLTGHQAVRCEPGTPEQAHAIVVTHNGAEQRIEFDVLIAAVGRTARLSGFGLEELGIEVGRVVQTNGYLQTKFPNILAAGDVAGPYQFTHVAAHQAWYAAVNALFGDFKLFKADYRVIPWTTFTDPEVARVGLSEAEAASQGIEVEVTRFELHELDRAIADSATKGFVKVLTKPGKDTILGATIVGAGAGDLLTEFVLAMKHGLGLNKILGTIHTYPTMAEANKYAAGEWKRA
ncbi:MAG: FAD-dependent oxidoreductase, partial [Burkholderiaceae bacterium]|nr:FAD-dependent oxidoreductase [Burkholderiaceae bacterium]